MRKVLTFLTASLVLTWVAPVMAQQAPDQFKDVEPNHWAYQAMENLRAKGIVIGYPDGYFRGRRTLTRYEFAVALDRALKSLPASGQGPQGEAGPAGPAGEAGPAGPAGKDYDPAEIDALKKLTNEFKDELSSLGNSVNAINAKLDGLAKDVAALKEAWDKTPKWSGQAFFGVRADRAAGNYVDRNGAVLGTNGPTELFRDPTVVNALELGVDAKVAGGSTFAAKLVFDNYVPTLGGNTAMTGNFVKNGSSEIYVDQAELKTPFNGLGRDGSLSIGRFSVQGAKYILWRPDVDVYFDNPIVDDGMYRVDGLKLSTKFGSLGVEVIGAQTKSVQSTLGTALNSPYLGALTNISADQLLSVTGKLPVRLLAGGYIRLSALGLSNNTASVVPGGVDSNLVVGADSMVKLSDRMGVNVNWAKSIEGGADFRTVSGGAQMNNAVEGKLGYDAGKLNVAAGYKYIDPNFYTPGYWDRIGPLVNPTGIKGPMVCAKYAFGDSLSLKASGEFLTGVSSMAGFLTPSDAINRITAGVKYNLSKSANFTVDWEGDYVKIDTGEGSVHPTIQYVNIGTGYNLTSGTVLKLGYEIGDYNGKGGSLPMGGSDHFNYNAFTTQVAVKF